MVKSTASTVTHSATGIGSQNSTPHSFVLPNVSCALQCTTSLFDYGTCYNNCVTGNGPSVTYTGGQGGVYTTPNTDVSGSKPVVTPGTNKTTTSGTATEPTGTPTTSGNYGTSSSSGTPTSTAGAGVIPPPFGTTSWQDFGIRAGLVVGGSILIIVGVIKIFSGQPVVSNVPGTLARRPSGPPRPIVTTRRFTETRPIGGVPTKPIPPSAATTQTPAQSSDQSRVDATQSVPLGINAGTGAKPPRKYTPKQVGAIHAKQRTHLAHK